jgi:guanosine-3',5'-bis(diphosphate) 3'-pyrophosphohydrolase
MTDATIRNSAKFFNKIKPFVSAVDLEMIQAGYVFSKYGHVKQFRDDGTRYFDHPRAVAYIIFDEWGIFDAQSILAALLHDMGEDSWLLSEYRIALNFGKDTAWDVRLLTKDEASKPVYYFRLVRSGSWRAILVKLADRIHNMRSLGNCTREKQLKQVAETRKEFPVLVAALADIIPPQYRLIPGRAQAELDRLCALYE